MLKSSVNLYLQTTTACLGAFVCGYTVSELGIVYNYLAQNYNINKFEPNDNTKITSEFRDVCVRFFFFF